MEKSSLKTVFSAAQPSGNLHLGNYLGAIKQWVELQDKYNCVFSIADYHAMTVYQEPKKLREKILETAMIYLAAGIDPKKSTIFTQSDISEHTELAWILNTITPMSELFRMTQFKDKGKKARELLINYTVNFLGAKAKKRVSKTKTLSQTFSEEENENENKTKEIIEEVRNISEYGFANVGLFDYPVLMVADILLYKTDFVPVGEDQKQHIEFTRTIVRRFNNLYGETFIEPKEIVLKEGARIMGLDNPLRKMSKSAENPANYIALIDSPTLIKEKIKRAITDSGKEIIYNEEKKPGISNLLEIYSLLLDKPIKQLEKEYQNKNYGEFKEDLSDVIINFLTPFQKELNKLRENPNKVRQILKNGAKKVRIIANKNLKEVKNKIGLNY